MTRRRYVVLMVVARLRVDSGLSATGARLHYPTADYQCLRCRHTESASGDAVPQFVATVRARHDAECPEKDTTP